MTAIAAPGPILALADASVLPSLGGGEDLFAPMFDAILAPPPPPAAGKTAPPSGTLLPADDRVVPVEVRPVLPDPDPLPAWSILEDVGPYQPATTQPIMAGDETSLVERAVVSPDPAQSAAPTASPAPIIALTPDAVVPVPPPDLKPVGREAPAAAAPLAPQAAVSAQRRASIAGEGVPDSAHRTADPAAPGRARSLPHRQSVPEQQPSAAPVARPALEPQPAPAPTGSRPTLGTSHTTRGVRALMPPTVGERSAVPPPVETAKSSLALPDPSRAGEFAPAGEAQAAPTIASASPDRSRASLPLPPVGSSDAPVSLFHQQAGAVAQRLSSSAGQLADPAPLRLSRQPVPAIRQSSGPETVTATVTAEVRAPSDEVSAGTSGVRPTIVASPVVHEAMLVSFPAGAPRAAALSAGVMPNPTPDNPSATGPIAMPALAEAATHRAFVSAALPFASEGAIDSGTAPALVAAGALPSALPASPLSTASATSPAPTPPIAAPSGSTPSLSLTSASATPTSAPLVPPASVGRGAAAPVEAQSSTPTQPALVMPAAQRAVAVAPRAIMPAFQAFGAALHRAIVNERKLPVPNVDPAGLSAPIAAPVAAAPAPAALDTTQTRWPEAMVTRIEQIRDLQTAPGTAADTRIRLHPDALGAIEVAIRRDGETVQVQLHAAEPATRALLADAQPRLTELAEAKGLKLSHGLTDSGAGDGHDRRQPAQQSASTHSGAAPVSAAEPDADTRLA